MVSTRNHPKQFPESPVKRSTSRSLSPAVPAIDALTSTTTSASPLMAPPATPATAARGRGRPRTTAAAVGWTHVPTLATRIWLLVSLPLVLWDTGYVLGRPHTLPGGKWHAPLWTPYELYGRVDGIYSPAAYARGEGFTGAQGLLNVIETLMYLVYAAMVWGKVGGVGGKQGGLAVLVGFSAALMTLSKTVLYCKFLSVGRTRLTRQGWSCTAAAGSTSRTTRCRTSSCSGSSPSKCGVRHVGVANRRQRSVARVADVHDMELRSGHSARTGAGIRGPAQEDSIVWLSF
jgi:hypothetical protein